MKVTITFFLVMSFILNAKSEEDGNSDILIEQIQFSRILPHAYCDQGKGSIKGMFPNSEIITFQRFSYLAGRPYCLMAYREIKEDDKIKITGVFLINTNAFRFETITAETNFGSTLLDLAEHIAGHQIQN